MTVKTQSVSPGGGVWAELAGQSHAIATFSRAAKAARFLLEKESDSEIPGSANLSAAMTHAWLVVGPPGSGRSVAARAFAAALECENTTEPGCGACRRCREVLLGIHPDVSVMATDLMQVSMADVKELVNQAYRYPSSGSWRVIIIEDYDRMSEISSNVLLKALEEPPQRTVWLLCAPAATDVIPTVRSRCRLVQLSQPTVQSVAELLVRRDGVDPILAAEVAAESGSHIGRAKALASAEVVEGQELTRGQQLRNDREQLMRMVALMRSSADACWSASALVKLVEMEAAARGGDSQYEQKQQVLRQFGLDGVVSDAKLPANVRAHLKRLEQNQKRRQRRLDFDAWDRVLEDLAGFYRDVLLTQLGAGSYRINQRLSPLIDQLAQRTNAERNIARLESIRRARYRLQRNCSPQLTAEALCLDLL